MKSFFLCASIIFSLTLQAHAQTPLEHLLSSPKPVFKKSHTLLPLGQSNCGLHPDIHTELAKNWGYGLIVNKRGLDKVAESNPGTHKAIASIASLYSYFDNYKGDKTGLPVLPPSTWVRNSNGDIKLNSGRPIVSPTTPDETFKIIGDEIGKKLAAVELSAGQPLELILNEGESGLWLAGEKSPIELFGNDPVIVDDFNASGLNDWYAYMSRNRARQESVLKEAIFKHLQSRPIYSLYQEQYGTERGRWSSWKRYFFLYEHFLDQDKKPLVSDYSSPEMYFLNANSGWSGIHFGSNVAWDALTQALNNISGSIKLGQKFSYPWVSMGGWAEQPRVSEPDRFMGMMKMYYASGAIGSVAGYFVCDGAIFKALYNNTDVGSAMPTAIAQMTIQGHAHALFSHLEEYLRDGDLLPGLKMHPYTGFTTPISAMEFPVEGETTKVQGIFNMVTIPTARVVARKIKDQDRWLIVAWANAGEDRSIKVSGIDPKLGTLTLRARKAGSIYTVKYVNGMAQVVLIDTNAMHPTRFLSP